MDMIWQIVVKVFIKELKVLSTCVDLNPVQNGGLKMYTINFQAAISNRVDVRRTLTHESWAIGITLKLYRASILFRIGVYT